MSRSGVLLLVAATAACSVPGHKSSAASGNGVVSSASPEATRAGLEVLARGGNAIDAAVAVAFDLGVTEPAGSGIGGQAFLLIQRPGEPAFVIHGSTVSPAATDPNATSAEVRGHRATTVPSMVKVMDLAWRRFGSGNVAWPDLLAPAIADAENGFVLGPFRRHSVAKSLTGLQRDPAVAAVFLAADGSVPNVGDRCTQPALGRTLRRLAEAGGDDFYRGEIAAAIAADMASNDGWITAADLAEFPEPKVGPALRGTYRGYDIFTLPPPAGGWVALFALNVLEHAPPSVLASGSADAQLWVAEALRAAHDRRLLSPIPDARDYARAVEQRLQKSVAAELVRELGMPQPPSPPQPPRGGGETTHFCVVDKDGTVVAATLSVNAYFGARCMSPELGFLYNDYMREFEIGNPGHPFALRPNALPYSSMSATVVSKDDVPLFTAGSPGSKRIISAVVQVTSNWIDRGLDVGAAVAAPRMHVVPQDDELMFESRPRSRPLLFELARRGFTTAMPLTSLFAGDRDPYFGGVHALARDPDGQWRGAADPRRDGLAAGLTAAPAPPPATTAPESR